MAKRKLSFARAVRSQEAQIARITKQVHELQQQGFQFNKQFLSSLKVTGKTASDANKKAAKFRGMTKRKIMQKVKSYTTDTGEVYTGKSAAARGRLAEQRKRKQKRITGLQNVEDALNMTADALHPDGKWINVSSEKRELLMAWNRYKDNVTAKNYNQDILDAVTDYANDIMNPSDSYEHYDSTVQKIYNLIEGHPMDPAYIARGGEEARSL